MVIAATAEDKAKTHQLMRDVLRKFADTRIRTSKSIGEVTQALEELQFEAERALERDRLDETGECFMR